MNPSFQDSLQYLRFQLMKASGYAVRCDQANDSIISRSIREVNFWKEEHHLIAGRHMLGIFLGILFLGVMLALLIWRGRKIRAHYQGLVDYANFSKERFGQIQEKLKDYDEDFEPLQLPTATQVSLWPKYYTRILVGANVLFVLVYIVLAF